ncbi:RUS family member 1-like isoform X2 [Convolutriloba macropyga]|uniref:RUS family member 1-like isoform X2 n=1 Tax=Convolutriloba macropyga TaxID=536237 RepID=UPI003F52219B
MLTYECSSTEGLSKSVLEPVDGAGDANQRCLIKTPTSLSVKEHTRRRKFRTLLSDLFLPRNYPMSVSDDYFEYQVWDSAQALFSSVCGTLAARATFEGLGVGEQSATVTGATFVWMLKTSSGMIGSIVFAYYQSSSLDAHCKQWRLFADILNDISLTLAIVSPLFTPTLFVLLSCLSSLFFALVGVAGETTRAALRQTFVWTLFLVATICHLCCNYRAVKCVTMDTLNPARFQLLVSQFRQNYDIFKSDSMSISAVNLKEDVFFWNLTYIRHLFIGVEINELSSQIVLSSDGKVMYSLGEMQSSITHPVSKIRVAFSSTCTPRDLMRASFVSYSLAEDMKLGLSAGKYGVKTLVKIIDELEREFDSFEKCLEDCGWKTCDSSLLGIGSSRFTPVH